MGPISRCQVLVDQPDKKRDLDPAPFRAKFKEVTQNIDAIFIDFRKVDIRVHSRLDAQDTITVAYRGYTTQLEALATRIGACKTKLEQLLVDLPFLQEQSTIFKKLPLLPWLMWRITRVQKRNQELLECVRSGVVRDAVKFCKQMIRHGATQKVDALPEEAHITMHRREQKVQDLASSAITSRISQLHQEVSTSTQEGQQENADNLNLSTYKDISLHPDRQFRMGQRGVWFSYFWIRNIVQQLQEQAQGLQKIEADVEADVKTLLQEGTKQDSSKLSHYTRVLHQVTRQILAARKELKSIDAPNQVPAGMHYAASLLQWSRDIQDIVAELQTRVPDPHIASVRFLNPQLDPFPRIHALFESAYLLNTSPPMQMRPAAQNIIAIWGPKLLDLDNEENFMMPRILAKREAREELLKSILMKELTSYFYLSSQDTISNPFFDLLLHTLSSHPKFAKKLKQLLSQDALLKAAYEAYCTSARFHEDAALLTQFSDLIYLLQKTEMRDVRIDYLVYGRCSLALYELPKSTSHRVKKLRAYIEKKLQEIRERHKSDLYGSVDHFATLMHSDPNLPPNTCLKATWGTDSHAKETCTALLRQWSKGDVLDRDGVRFFYIDYLLVTFERGKTLESAEKTALATFLVNYLQPNPPHGFWGEYHGIRFMECLLAKAVTTQFSRETIGQIENALKSLRGEAYFDVWKEFMLTHTIPFLTHIPEIEAGTISPVNMEKCQQHFRKVKEISSAYKGTKGPENAPLWKPVFEYFEQLMADTLQESPQ